MYWKDLLSMLKEAFPVKATIAVLAVVVGFSFWGHYITKEVVKPVTDPVVEVVESTIRTMHGPNTTDESAKQKQKHSDLVMVPDISQDPNRSLRL